MYFCTQTSLCRQVYYLNHTCVEDLLGPENDFAIQINKLPCMKGNKFFFKLIEVPRYQVTIATMTSILFPYKNSLHLEVS